MNDSELRGIVLDKFYDARHKVDRLTFGALAAHVTINYKVLENICGQLAQLGLIDWMTLNGQGGVLEAVGSITAKGVNVIERTEVAPAAIILHDRSIKISGSTNVQIGNSNTQSVQNQLGELMDIIDKMNPAPHEKQEAKSLIEKITSNPLLVAAFGTVLGKTLGQ
jgi:hypothetical protein